MWPNLVDKQRGYSPAEPVTLPVLASDGSNKNDFFCSDVVGNKRFAQNLAGYPRSDIALINEQQSLAVAQKMLDDLAVLPSSAPNADMSDSDILLGLRSKYCQSPSEVISRIERELERRQNAAKVEEMESAVVDSSKTTEEIIDNA